MAPPANVAVVLAAGAGRRFAGPAPKLASRIDGDRTLAAVAVRTALDARIGPVLVVCGAVPPDALDLPAGTTILTNPRWAEGQASSLGVAIAAARELGTEAVVVGLADQPGLTVDAWRAVAATSGTPIAVATYRGRRGHPVRLAATVWNELPETGDEGARTVLRARPELVTEVACTGDPVDLDTVEDLAAWRSAPR